MRLGFFLILLLKILLLAFVHIPGTIAAFWTVFTHFRRSLEIGKQGAWLVLKGPTPERLHDSLRELGGAWVKLGQTLALRYDLIPGDSAKDYGRALFELLDDGEKIADEDVIAIIASELGQHPDSIFQSFNYTESRSASIGQIHQAALHSGEKVAVKIQRPNIRRDMETDIKIMFAFAPVIDALGFFGATRTRTVIREFQNWVEKELDFRVEARQAQKIVDNAEGYTLEKNACVYWNYTTRRVLTMEWMEGIPINHIVRALHDGDNTYLESVRDQGYDLDVIAKHINWNLMNQVHVHGYFHADLHPANMFARPGNVIGYVDFGIVGHISEELRDSGIGYFWNLFQGKTDQATDELMRWVTPSRNTDLKAVREELVNIMEDWLFQIRHPEYLGSGAEKKSIEVEILRAIRHHQMILADEMVIYLKTFSTAFTVINDLSPDFDIYSQVSQFFSQMITSKLKDATDPRLIARTAFEYNLQARRVFQTLDMIEEAENRIELVIAIVRRRLHILGVFAAAILLGILFSGLLVFTPFIFQISEEQPDPTGIREWFVGVLKLVSTRVDVVGLLYGFLVAVFIVLAIIAIRLFFTIRFEGRELPISHRRRRGSSGNLDNEDRRDRPTSRRNRSRRNGPTGR